MAARSPGHPMDATKDANQILFFSTIGGLSPLIPVPYLDVVFAKVVRQLMIASQLRNCGLQPTMSQVISLTREPAISPLQCACKVAYYGCCCFMLEFVFKKCCFCLALKDCVEITCGLLHEGWLLAYAVKAGYLTQQTLASKVDLWRLREAIIQTCDEVDTSPIRKAVNKLLGANQDDVSEAASTVLGALSVKGIGIGPCKRRPHDDEVQEVLDSVENEHRSELRDVTQGLADVTRSQRPYFDKLESAFEGRLQKLRNDGAKPGMLCSLIGG